ncbi:MAG TPA: MBL fold metallo-hydrolase [Pseudogracilibacillus sp.]|nr:MBL fold metallo-hydrolase [Pseudogracilibacillus sp.]
MKKFIQLIYILISVVFFVACADESELTTGETNKETNHEEIDVTEATDEVEESSVNVTSNEMEEEKEAPTGSLAVHYIDVGQADATLLQLEDEKEQFVLLYDTGDWQGSEVVPFLEQQNIEAIDVIIISHPHADHIGQLSDVINKFDVDEVWMTGNSANTNVFADAMEAMIENDVTYDEPEAGDVFDIGSLTLEVLHPHTLTGGLNEDSLSIRITFGDVSFVFTGDAYTAQETEIIERNESVKADILQLGHHGSNTSSGQPFLEAVAPTYAIYSAGANNSYGHPSPEVIERVQAMGITLLGTDVHGTITVTTDGKAYDVTTEKTGEVVAKTKTPQEKTTSKNKPKEKVTSNCIDLNEAPKEQLMDIIHIGDVRADEIIKLRPFSSVDDLSRVNGIGPARISDIKDENKACVGDS